MGIKQIHHLNCGTGHPVGASILVPELSEIACRVLMIETTEGIVLVDTGALGQDTRETLYDRSIEKGFFRFSDISQSALSQIKKLGFRANDVRDIILTHLDSDHINGIGDFPLATIHLTSREFSYKDLPLTAINRFRYRKASLLNDRTVMAHAWSSGERWNGFECVRPLHPKLTEIAMISLPGHTIGHCGVAVESNGRYVVHAGDAFYHASEVIPDGSVSYGFAQFRKMIDFDHRIARANLEHLRSLKEKLGDQLLLVCAHDHLYGAPCLPV